MMTTLAFSKIMRWISPRARRAGKARDELKANAEKALAMKRAAGSEAHVPPHQTAREGMQPGPENTDTTRQAQQGAFTPQLKRSRVARSGDAS